MRRRCGLVLCALLLAARVDAAISCSALTAGGLVSSASSYATASITPSANQLILASVWHSHTTTAGNQPTATGNSLTWVVVGSFTFLTTERFTMFRAMGASPTTGAITFDFSAQNQNQAGWTVSQCSGVDTSGTNGSGAVTANWHNNTGTTTTPAVAMGAFGNANNGTYGVLVTATNTAPTKGANFTQLSNVNVVSGFRMVDEWAATNQSSVNWTTASAAYGAMGVEVVAAAAATVTPTMTTLGAGPGQ